MGFVELNGYSLNSEHIGEVKIDSKDRKISYIFMGGRTEDVTYDSQADFESAVSEIGSIIQPQTYYIVSSDLSSLPTNGPMGTAAYCVDTQQVFMLNSKTQQWVEQ